MDREVDHGEESKVEEEICKEESRSGTQKEKNDEVVEEGGAEEEGQEGCTEAQSCCAEAQGRGAEACGQSDASARACSSADTGSGYAAGVRRYWQRRYELALAPSVTRRSAIEPAPRQTRLNRIVYGRIARPCRGQ
jgi:hypothetical protein